MLPDISLELKLLLSCSGRKVDSSELDCINWDRFLSLAVRHKVQGAIKPALSECADKVPRQVQIKIDYLYQQNIARTLNQLHMMQQVGSALSAAGIDHLFVKGASLANYYPNLTDRHAGDVDILIRSTTKLWAAVALLKGSGFEQLAPKIELNEAQCQEYLRRAKDVELYSAKHKMRIELHTRLVKNRTLWEQHVENIFENREAKLIEGQWYPGMSSDLEGLYVMLHGGLDRWFRLKWLFDAHLIFKDCNAERFEASYQFAVTHGLERAYLLCMQMSMLCFDMPAPGWLQKLASNNKAVQTMCDRSVRAICRDSVPRDSNVSVFGVLGQLSAGIRQEIDMKSGLSHVASSISSGMFNARNWEVLKISPRYHFLYKPLAPLIILLRMSGKIFKF